MEISNDTMAVINYLDDFTKGNLRKKNDFSVILEICAAYDNADTLNRLVFTGKSLWNIYSKLRKVGSNTEGIELLQKETERCCNEMTVYLKDIISYSDEDLQKRFDDVYFQLTRGCVKNLIDLAHDLSKFKELQSLSRSQS